ncbi:hypothetical protein Q7P37_006289 [Cladosporium fusiforme]
MAEDAITSPPVSTLSSPFQRPSSPPLSISPSLALDAVPTLDRTVSTPTCSTISTISSRSRYSRLSEGGGTVVKRRGYMRPQGTNFADSARNRDSVMSLGSIAHMQYYFARTGLLDGKGAQLAKGDMKKKKKDSAGESGKENMEPYSLTLNDDFGVSSLSLEDGTSSCAVSDPGYDRSVVESPTEIYDGMEPWSSPAPPMLPPTVSTYKLKPSYTEPLPDLPVLRRELKEALQDALKVLEESQKQTPPMTPTHTQHQTPPPSAGGEDPNAGFWEVQGLHLLDIMTLAIRAAKNYYTAHSDHAKLYAIKSEKDLRADLYQVLDVLKRMASRNFRGGMRVLELAAFLSWIESIDGLLKKEHDIEEREAAERESWTWREGDWSGREREREWLFLKSFDPSPSSEELPQWPEKPISQKEDESNVVEIPSDFLVALQDGQRLIRLHNALVARSKRKFGEIKTWHTDVGKPYRMAENLRYWSKAAELRFDVRLGLPVQDVVHGEAWAKFDEAVLKWSSQVRSELLEEWEAESKAMKPPKLKIEEDVGGNSAEASQRFNEALVSV